MTESKLSIDFLRPESQAEIEQTRSIFLDYARSLQVDLCFQDFEDELALLPGDYQAPGGSLLLVRVDGAVAGCCAVRPLGSAHYANACEMKRLYVRNAFRGKGLGRLLAEQVMQEARLMGYSSILLDTLDEMEAARALYEDLGFAEIAPYYHNPIPGAHYLMAELKA